MEKIINKTSLLQHSRREGRRKILNEGTEEANKLEGQRAIGHGKGQWLKSCASAPGETAVEISSWRVRWLGLHRGSGLDSDLGSGSGSTYETVRVLSGGDSAAAKYPYPPRLDLILYSYFPQRLGFFQSFRRYSQALLWLSPANPRKTTTNQ